MTKTTKEPNVSVWQRVDVSLSRDEVEHALRCWLAHKIAPHLAPAPKSLADIAVSVSAGDDCLFGATLTYEPALATPAGGEEGRHD